MCDQMHNHRVKTYGLCTLCNTRELEHQDKKKKSDE